MKLLLVISLSAYFFHFHYTNTSFLDFHPDALWCQNVGDLTVDATITGELLSTGEFETMSEQVTIYLFLTRMLRILLRSWPPI